MTAGPGGSHALPAEAFAALARGGGGAAAAGHLRASERGRHMLLILGVVEAARRAGHPHAGAAERAYAALAALERVAPAAVDTLIRYPAVGAWARATAGALLRGTDATGLGGTGATGLGGTGAAAVREAGATGLVEAGATGLVEVGAAAPRGAGAAEWGGHDPARLGAMAAAAALRAGLPYEGEAPVAAGHLTLPSLGRLAVPGEDGLVRLTVRPGGRVTAGPAEVTVTHVTVTDVTVTEMTAAEMTAGETTAAGTSAGEIAAAGVGVAETVGRWRGTVPGADADSPAWRGLHRLTAEAGGRRLTVLLDDLDPYRWPAGSVRRGPLPGPEREALAARLRDAWRLLQAGHRTLAEETAAIVTVLTPIDAPEHDRTRSASSGDHFGTLALSAPPDGLWLAGTFAHEVQHAKLGALLTLVPLLRPDDGRRFYAPWRDDPRPAHGLLHGAYAFLGVTGFWRRQRRLLEDEEDRFRAEVEFARWREAAYEATGTLAASGLLTEAGEAFVAGMRGTLEGWLKEPARERADAAARHESARHRARWNTAHS
ncbi:aKG-HExxH-type peptide beta-hydroxylase [Nonomuraea rhodomycinica]|uniref:HEXXH motif domain-containing protein n=1 Tax=Nonomuraea rhodomycinica TaxID=1712872 RepID=A0A7Y6INP7_9ACTN|nr:HEXXH motif-containing putative peptide modification protein [Nonomuraea rhodomycinica]NUW40269.1 HEXXH motif domain-containing protein [Nonomuraea rhodomycinica]